MARNYLSLILFLGVVGLVVGYFIFAKAGSSYLPIDEIITGKASGVGGAMQAIGFALTKGQTLAEVRSNILYSGLAGAGLGLVIAILYRKRT